MVLRVNPQETPLIDRCSDFCTAEAGRCRIRTLPYRPPLPNEVRPWRGKKALEFPILLMQGLKIAELAPGVTREELQSKAGAPLN